MLNLSLWLKRFKEAQERSNKRPWNNQKLWLVFYVSVEMKSVKMDTNVELPAAAHRIGAVLATACWRFGKSKSPSATQGQIFKKEAAKN